MLPVAQAATFLLEAMGVTARVNEVDAVHPRRVRAEPSHSAGGFSSAGPVQASTQYCQEGIPMHAKPASPHTFRTILVTASLAAASLGAFAIVTDLGVVDRLHDPLAEHADQAVFFGLVTAGQHAEAFELAFALGDELFETEFNALDGAGANVGQGQRFSRVPRADLAAGDEWANHFPPRATGPNAQACNACHDKPFDDGAGGTESNVLRDPQHSGVLASFILRNTPHLFSPGSLQRLAEEMTTELQAIRQKAIEDATAGSGILIDADFENGTGGFAFVDDPFRNTSNPAFARGERVAVGNGFKLLIDIGGIDNTRVLGMSGGWRQSFELAQQSVVTVSFEYRLTQLPNYESDERSELLVSIDDTVAVVASLTGDGNGGQVMTTGFQRFTANVPLSAGTHTLTIGTFNNKKTFFDEVTLTLVDDVRLSAGGGGGSVTRDLSAKGVGFGRITAFADGTVDTSQVEGVSEDLVVRPFQWKGENLSLREFNRGAGHNEIGMQPVELVGAGVDGDFDGVVDELTIGDLTALSIYLAAQPRPTSLVELADLGLVPPLEDIQRIAIDHGRTVFEQTGCATCHTPRLLIDDPTFSEPSTHPAYRDQTFPAGQDPIAELVDPAVAVTFDLTRDQPDNVIELATGEIVLLGSLVRDASNRGIAEIFGDLKRHDMGPGLAENIDEIGTGASVWMTQELWGVGSTSPYLHDGRATTLTEAILEHGGEADASRIAFENLLEEDQSDLIAFLDNLVLFKMPEPQ
jgi:hypothetical protein